MYPSGLGLIFYIPVCSAVCIFKGREHLYDCTPSTFCVFDMTVLNYYHLVFMNHVDTSQLERLCRGELSCC